MSKTSNRAAKLVPWVRRALAHEPSVTRLRLFHTGAVGRQGVHMEDIAVPEPRPESMTAEDIAQGLFDVASAHAESFGGRQVYEVLAVVGDDGDTVSRTPIVIVASPETAFDGTSEPTDMRSFGAMASRHSESMMRMMLTSNQAMFGALTSTLDRLGTRLERSESRVEALADRLFATTEDRMAIEADRARLNRERQDEESSAQIKAEAWQFLQQIAPVLLPAIAKAGQKLLAAPKKPKRSKRKQKKTATSRGEAHEQPDRH